MTANHFRALVPINAVRAHPTSNPLGSISIKRRGESPTRPYASERPHGFEPGSAGAIVAQFKKVVTKRINLLRKTPGAPVWQRNYLEHVIRKENKSALMREHFS